MNEVRKVVFHSARQEDAQEKFLEKQRRRAEFDTYLLIIIALILLIGALTLLMDQLQVPVPTLISAL
jgi:hypothetical protein